ncbi:MAG: TauD/TfdA family dioxygenase [Pseudomonadota bacterium]
MHINALGKQIGVEITGVDVRDLGPGEFDAIYAAWLRYGVAVVRDQHLEIDEFLSYSRRFGRLHEHPSKSTRHPEHPELTVLGIDKFDADGKLIEAVYARGGATWHTDGAYEPDPYKATQLYALAIPSRGGDTLFASMYAACDGLPAKLKERLVGAMGAFTYGGRTDENSALLNPEDRAWTPVHHPILRRHPETGRTGLFFDPGKIVCIEGMSRSESDDLIDDLTERMVQPDGQYRHQWRKGDIVIWDNRCCYHKAAADYPPNEDRIHWRVSIKEPLSTESPHRQGSVA